MSADLNRLCAVLEQFQRAGMRISVYAHAGTTEELRTLADIVGARVKREWSAATGDLRIVESFDHTVDGATVCAISTRPPAADDWRERAAQADAAEIIATNSRGRT
jgi:hypothetical protein